MPDFAIPQIGECLQSYLVVGSTARAAHKVAFLLKISNPSKSVIGLWKLFPHKGGQGGIAALGVAPHLPPLGSGRPSGGEGGEKLPVCTCNR